MGARHISRQIKNSINHRVSSLWLITRTGCDRCVSLWVLADKFKQTHIHKHAKHTTLCHFRQKSAHSQPPTYTQRDVNICEYCQALLLHFELQLISITEREQADTGDNRPIGCVSFHLTIHKYEHIGEITRYENVALSTRESLLFNKERLIARYYQ